MKACAATIIRTAVVHRMTYRHGERGCPYPHLDAEHVGQHDYTGGGGHRMRAVAMVAFRDDDVNRLLGPDWEDRFAIYLGTVGKE